MSETSGFGATAGIPAPLTNLGDTFAYFLAQAITIAFSYGVALSGLLAPIYIGFVRARMPLLSAPLTLALDLAWAALAFGIFVSARALFGGASILTPPPPSPGSVATRPSEATAYAVAQLVCLSVLVLINGAIGVLVYSSVRLYGVRLANEMDLILAFAVRVIVTIVAFLVFAALRRAFAPRPG